MTLSQKNLAKNFNAILLKENWKPPNASVLTRTKDNCGT